MLGRIFAKKTNIRRAKPIRTLGLTVFTRVVDLDVFVCAGTRVSEDGGVHGHLAGLRALAPRADDAQRARRHAVDAPVGVAVRVADRDGEASVVCADDVEVEAGRAADVQPRVLARVLSLVKLLLDCMDARGRT